MFVKYIQSTAGEGTSDSTTTLDINTISTALESATKSRNAVSMVLGLLFAALVVILVLMTMVIVYYRHRWKTDRQIPSLDISTRSQNKIIGKI